MDNLRKILTGMIVLLVVIVVGGGFYLASMGGMNHGASQTTHNAGDKQNTENSRQNNQNSDDAKKAEGSSNQPTDPGQMADNKGNDTFGPAGAPVIVQIQPPKTDPGLYVQLLQEKLKSINEANSSIASNSGGHGTADQQNSSSTGNMNQLHQDFYQLGKDIASMEQNLNQLSNSIRDNKLQASRQYSYNYPNSFPYANPQYPGYPYYPYWQGPLQQNQQNQQNLQNQQNQQNQQSNNQAPQGSVTDSSSHSNMNMSQSQNGNLLNGLFNVVSIKTFFNLILLGSVILGIISLVGFLASLFKPNPPQSGINNDITL